MAQTTAMAEACRTSGGKARGVATVKRTVSDTELHDLHNAYVRGVRFNFVRRLVDFTPKDELLEIAHRISRLGWHVVIYFSGGPARVVGLLHCPAHSRCRRSHGPTDAQNRSTDPNSNCS
jgi:hypothetical protein